MNRYKSLAPMILTSIGLVLWILSVLTKSGVDLATGGLGLFSVLPPIFYVSLSLFVISFFLALRFREAGNRILYFQTFVLVLVLYLTPAILEGSARFTSAYVNYQSVNYISQNRHIDPTIQWIHNWPGFSILYSIVSQTSALPAQLLLSIYPTFINLLIFFPLLAFFHFVFKDNRLIWLSTWVFYLANWIGQDYFSMQSYGFFVFLLFFAVLFRFAGLNSVSRLPNRRWTLVLIILFSAAVISHALTSIALLSLVLVFFVGRVMRPLIDRRFVAILGLILVGWSVFGAQTYLSSNLSSFISQAFDLGSIFQSNIGGRLVGSTEHALVANIRLVFSSVFLLFAGLGVTVLWKERNKADFGKPILLALLSVIMLGGFFSYGGELFMRLYLFTLVPLVYLISKGGTKRGFFIAIAVFLIVAAPTLHVVAHYGNEVMDYVPKSELTGVRFFYNATSEGIVMGGYRNSEFYMPYEYFDFVNTTWKNNVLEKAFTYSVHTNWPKYTCISYGGRALYEFLLGEPNFFADLENNITKSTHYAGIYSNPSLEVYLELP